MPEHEAAFHPGQHTPKLNVPQWFLLLPGSQQEAIGTLRPHGNLVDVLQFRGMLVVVFVLFF